MEKTATSEKPRNHWTVCMQGAFGSGVTRYRCSHCGGVSPVEKGTCPHCGVVMGAKAAE